MGFGIHNADIWRRQNASSAGYMIWKCMVAVKLTNVQSSTWQGRWLGCMLWILIWLGLQASSQGLDDIKGFGQPLAGLLIHLWVSLSLSLSLSLSSLLSPSLLSTTSLSHPSSVSLAPFLFFSFSLSPFLSLSHSAVHCSGAGLPSLFSFCFLLKCLFIF